MMNTPISQKVALITGGSKRIGRQISQTLHAFGYQIIIHYHQSFDTAKSLCNELNAIRPHSAKIVQADLSVVNDKTKLTDFKTQVLASFGRLDCIVHNASSFYPSSLDDDFDNLQNHWDDLFLTNAKAPLFISQVFLDELTKNHGQIVSLLDIHADNKPFIGYPIYTMAKAAHKAMVHSLALELSPNVRVNGVSPGVNVLPPDFDENQSQLLLNSVPLKQIGTPSDIAQTVLFLLNAPYVTGQVIAVDGGRSLTLKGDWGI